MLRRLSALVALSALAVTTLPALPAFASAAATATLTGGAVGLPGARTFTVKVTNTEAPVLGKTINAIRINLPVNEAGIRLGDSAGSATGFTASATNLGTTQYLTYSGGALSPGSSVDITFPAAVAAPLARDLSGDLRVQVSSDNLRTMTSVASLPASVKVLEILQEELKPVAPTSGDRGVTDRTGTAGQPITYATAVRNHARSPLQVTATLSSPAGDAATPTTVTVPAAGGTALAEIPLALASTTADRTTVLTATAIAEGANAAPRTDSFTVQAPATVALTDLQPTRTRSGAGSAQDFTALATKAGTPALTLSDSTLSFGGNLASAAGPIDFASGASSRRLTYSTLEVTGADGSSAASIVSAGTDDNLAGYSYSADLGAIVIDNVAPALDVTATLPEDVDGAQQVAAKDGDSVTVGGTITGAADIAASTLRVVLDPDQGPDVPVSVTLGGSGESRTFTGTVSPTFDPAATEFLIKAEVADQAGNIGSAVTPVAVPVDNALPVLGSGVVLTPTTIEVTFDDTTGVAGGCDPNAWSLAGTPGSVTDVRTADGSPCEALGTGGRVLTLRSALGVDETPRVTYEAPNPMLVKAPAKDGAGNTAARQTVNTISNLVPLAPVLDRLERRDGEAYESAYLDTAENAYYTNASGADALQLTVSGIRKGYTLQVLDGGSVVATKTFTADPAPLATSYSGALAVPLPAGDATRDLAVRFLSAGGNIGPSAPLRVVLDTVAPAIGAAGMTDATTVVVPFSEPVVGGTDFSGDWFVSETVDTEEGPAERTVNVDAVSGTEATSRTLSVSLLDPTRFAGVDYYLNSPEAVRYEDRAGNMLGDTLVPAS